MKGYLLSAALLFLFFDVNAQYRKVYKVNPGQRVYDAIPRSAMYRYAEFGDGQVFLKDGTFAPGKLNYNSLFGKMQFIVKKTNADLTIETDTLSLGDENNIKFISIDTDTFYYNNGYLELIASSGKIKLAKRKIFEIVNKQRIGAMGSNAGEIETFTSMNSSQAIKELVPQEILNFSEVTSFYLGDAFDHFTKLNKKSILNLYPGQSKKISDWLKDNKTNFENENDMKNLFAFLQSL